MNLDIDSISFQYEGRILLNRFSLQLSPKTVTVILGPSGVGKSTLLRILAGLETAHAGDVRRSGSIAYLPQDDVLLPWKTVRENILLPLTLQKKSASLETLHITPLLDLYPNQLSGGQRQMVAFERFLLEDKEVLLLDEPFSNVDAYIRIQLLNRLKTYVESGKSALLVTHDFQDALRVADRIVLLSPGGSTQLFDEVVPKASDLENAMSSCYI